MAAAARLILLRETKLIYSALCYSLAARGYSCDPAFLTCLYMGNALFGPEPPKCLEALYRANTTLFPEKWMRTQTAEDIAAQVRREVRPDLSAEPVRPDDWDQPLRTALREYEDNRTVLAAFPPRTPQGLSIRHVRASDVWSYYVECGRKAELARCLRLLRKFDYITMVNVLLAAYCSRGRSGGTPWRQRDDSRSAPSISGSAQKKYLTS